MAEMTVESIRAASPGIQAMLDKIMDRAQPLDEDQHQGKTSEPAKGKN
jgi:hypothetical protein